MRILLIFIFLLSFCASQESPEDLFEKAYFLETAENDVERAIEIYNQILDSEKSSKAIVTKAKERLEICNKSTTVENDKSTKSSNEILENINEALQNKLITIDFTETPLLDLLKFLQSISKINMICTSNVLQKKENVSMSLKNLSLKNCLDLLCHLHEMDYIVIHHAIVIGENSEIQSLKKKKIAPMPDGLTQTLSVDLVDVPLDELVDFVATTCNVNILTRSGVFSQKAHFTGQSLSHLNVYDFLSLVCIQVGGLSLSYRNGIFIIEQEKEKEEDKKIIKITMQIQHNTLPTQKNYPDIKVSFRFENQKEVFVKTTSIFPNRMISLEEYLEWKEDTLIVTIKQPGFHEVVKTFEADELSIDMNVFLQAQERLLSFDMFDLEKNKLVTAEKVTINGNISQYNSTYQPGETIDIEVSFAEYQDYKAKVLVAPGEGPFIIKVPLVGKK